MLRSVAYRASIANTLRSQSITARRSFLGSVRTAFPRQVTSILLPPGTGPPGDGDDGQAGPSGFFSKQVRKSRTAKGARGGGSDDGPSAPPPPKQPALPASFAEEYVTSPAADGEPSSQILALRNVLLASFSPSIQKGNADPTVAIVCPLEGGEHVVRKALGQAAGLLGADVVRIDAVAALGMRQYGALGEAGSCLFLSNNPLVTDTAKASSAEESAEDEDGGEDQDEGEYEQIQEGQPMELHIPIPTAFAVAARRNPFGPRAGHKERPTKDEDAKIDQLFKDIVNVENKVTGPELPSSSQRRRIIYIQDASAMASTFAQWFPSLCAAVKARRIQRDGAEETLQPTTIVLGCTPSLLHVAPNMRQEQAKAADAAAQGAQGAPAGLLRLLGGASGMLGGPFGANQRRDQDGLWMSSAEDDLTGRRVRLGKRLKALNGPSEEDIRSLLPPFNGAGETSTSNAQNGPPDALKAMMSRIGAVEVTDLGSSGSDKHEDGKTGVNVWKVVGVLPDKRVIREEANERRNRRLSINTLRLRKALGQSSVKLTESMPSDELNEDDHQSGRSITEISRELSSLRESFANSVWSWRYIQHFATMALGHSLSQAPEPLQDLTVTWKSIAEAAILDARKTEEQRQWTQSHHKKAAALADAEEHGGENMSGGKGDHAPPVDPVVESVKKDRTLSQHEKRLLGCIVDIGKLSSTTFDDVLLPDKTIDAVRTVVSLPLLYPEAFHSGVLAQHSTSGCLLFGPPGTGKTLLVRALAKESGARMLAVQPSDVSDMYVGEGEKLVKAVFSLARRLSPCIVFLDEVDSLFGARSGRGAGGGAQAHQQVLTEFMQEMDGLSSAVVNREKQIVVMGATNRPYDLDEAVLRRLPRRLLVDLPGMAERLAILKIHLKHEQLGPDVDLEKIARDTDTYSGSDLKHLCVSAALAAIKESVKIPWKAKSSQAVQPAAQPAGSSGPAQTNALANDRPEEEQGVKKPVEPVTSTVTAAGPDVSTLCQGGPMMGSEAEPPSHEPSPTPANDGTMNETLFAAQMDLLDNLDSPSAGEATSDDRHDVADICGSSRRDEAQLMPSRILKAAHFETALKEITPSSSEDGNLPELRKWAEQYGEGGTKRGKKAGYGSKFGFGDAKDQKKDAGYGRVRPEDD